MFPMWSEVGCVVRCGYGYMRCYRLESRYYQVGGNNYCEADREVSCSQWGYICHLSPHPQVALPLCSSCHLPLQSGSLTVSGVSFHPHCFVCTICGNPIMGKFITREDGHYICEEDYMQSKEKCDHCGLPKLDRVQTAINKNFNPAFLVRHIAEV